MSQSAFCFPKSGKRSIHCHEPVHGDQPRRLGPAPDRAHHGKPVDVEVEERLQVAVMRTGTGGSRAAEAACAGR